MSTLKTQPNDLSVTDFISKVENETKRNDSFELVGLMSKITGEKPVMWGTSIIGFGSYQYKYESGREGEWFLTGFSPRKQTLALYLMSGLSKSTDLIDKLGKYKTGKGCLYIKKLDDVDRTVLRKLIEHSVMLLRQ